MLNIDTLPVPPSRDDPTNFSDRADQFLGAMPNFRDQVNAALNILSTAGTVGVSTSSVAVGTGSKSFTAEAGKVWTAGAFVLVVSGANIGRQMHGQVTAYNPTTGALTVNVIVANGTGTAADWIIMLAAPDLMPLYSTDAGKGASLIGVNDGAGNFTGTTVEAVLAELFGAMARKGAENVFTAANTFNEPVTAPMGTEGGHLVNLVQLLGRAPQAGNSAQTFAVGAATADEHALRRDQVNVANAEVVKTAVNASGDPPIYACRAWVNFNGAGTTVSIRASGNVSSVTDNGVGDYTINFISDMPDASYAISGFSAFPTNTTAAGSVSFGNDFAPTAGALRIKATNSTSGAPVDSQHINVSVHR